MLYILILFLQQTDYKNTILDMNKNPIEYATIQIVNSAVGTYSDSKGNFTLTMSNESLIRISCQGYISQTISTSLPAKPIILSEDIHSENLVNVVAERHTLKRTLPIVEIDAKQLKKTGKIGLAEVLNEQADIQVTPDNLVILRGFDPAYTLILIDGEPVLSNTFDLSTINISDVEKIEVLKGPSSFLYGNKAVAGSINIITKTRSLNSKNSDDLSFETKSIYQSYNKNAQQQIWLNKQYQNTTIKLFGNLTRSLEVDHHIHNINPSLTHWFSNNVKFKTTFGYSDSKIFRDKFSDIIGKDEIFSAKSTDITSSLKIQSDNLSYLKLSTYLASNTENLTRKNAIDNQFNTISDEEKGYYKIASTGLISISKLLQLNSQAGFIKETQEEIQEYRESSQYYLLSSLDMDFGKIKTVAGLRYDNHEKYNPKLSPRIGIEYTYNNFWTIKSSIGEGFKAPEFSELYYFHQSVSELNYAIIGSEKLEAYLKDKDVEYIVDKAKLGDLKAEYSTGSSLDIIFSSKDLNGSISFYHNNLKDHIISGRVAYATSATTKKEKVTSYYNIDEFITRGIEVSLKYNWNENTSFFGGYHYSEAYDPSIQEFLETKNSSEKLYQQPGYQETTLLPNEYFGIHDRPKHTFSYGFNIIEPWYNSSIYFTGKTYGKMGFADTNPNGIIDDFDLFTPSYTLLDISIAKQFSEHIKLSIQTSNILNITNDDFNKIRGRAYKFQFIYNY